VTPMAGMTLPRPPTAPLRDLDGARAAAKDPAPDAAQSEARDAARDAARGALLFGGLLAAASIRAAVNGGGAPAAFGAGSAFGFALVVLVVAAGWRPAAARSRGHAVAITVGLLAGALLAAIPRLAGPAAGVHLFGGGDPLAAWVAVTLLVACAEEMVCRGALIDALAPRMGTGLAAVVGAVAFALAHVPLYGWHVVPLDLAVGVVLGGLRIASGTLSAPVAAHVVADLATRWM
jgi:membrane protease YdiL (CAAX protease family)